MANQHPVEIILARSLMSNLTSAAFLVDTSGTLVFFNEAAGRILGVRYEEVGAMQPDEWGKGFNPTRRDGTPLELEQNPLVIALNEQRPAHVEVSIHTATGDDRWIEVSAFPIVGNTGLRGGMAIFWEADGD